MYYFTHGRPEHPRNVVMNVKISSKMDAHGASRSGQTGVLHIFSSKDINMDLLLIRTITKDMLE